MADQSWSKHVADVLRRNDIRTFATVPDYIVTHVLVPRPPLRHAGVEKAMEVRAEAELRVGEDGPFVVCVKVAAGRAEGRLDRDVVGYARRFRRALAALPAR